jgi:hypothetical protein
VVSEIVIVGCSPYFHDGMCLRPNPITISATLESLLKDGGYIKILGHDFIQLTTDFTEKKKFFSLQNLFPLFLSSIHTPSAPLATE